MKTSLQYLLFLGNLVAMAGCSIPITCPAISLAALEVRVKNARTGQFIASGATISLRFNGVDIDGNSTQYPVGPGADSLPIHISGSSGTYDIRVRRAGFADFVQKGIVVTGSGHCNQPQIVALTATLVPLP